MNWYLNSRKTSNSSSSTCDWFKNKKTKRYLKRYNTSNREKIIENSVLNQQELNVSLSI